MNLQDARENYYFYSGRTSDIIRQLGLGAIAIVWIFHSATSDGISIPRDLVYPLILVVAGLGCDLLQYSVASIAWSIFHWQKERSGLGESAQFKAPEQINWPAIFFFYAKVALIVAAYWMILEFLMGKLVVVA